MNDKLAHPLRLKDDALHRQTEALAAAALRAKQADRVKVLGSLLMRVKYANDILKAFESSGHDLAVLLRVWAKAVAKRSAERAWFPKPRIE